MQIDDWNTCGPSTGNPSCADYYNAENGFWNGHVTTVVDDTFTLAAGYNYCLSKATTQVKESQTVRIWQDNVVAYDKSTKRTNCDRYYNTNNNWNVLTDLDGGQKCAFYIQALVSLTNVPDRGCELISNEKLNSAFKTLIFGLYIIATFCATVPLDTTTTSSNLLTQNHFFSFQLDLFQY